MREDIWLNFDSKVTFDDVKNPQRIAIVNPEALRNVSAEKIWNRITKAFGKCEFETWVAEEIVATTMKAVANGSKIANLIDISKASLYMNYDDLEQNWKLYMDNKTFVNMVKKLDIFKIVKDTSEELLLDYIG